VFVLRHSFGGEAFVRRRVRLLRRTCLASAKRAQRSPFSADSLCRPNWYIGRSSTAAEGFVREIEHALERIAEAPERYPLTRFGRRRFVLLNYPYDVVYRIVRNDIEIVAIAHHARRPGSGGIVNAPACDEACIGSEASTWS
jgi:plasmid stabilization system protein ParE